MSGSALPVDPIAEARRHWVEHGWGDSATGMAAVTSIMRAQQILLGRVDAQLKPLGLTFARYEVLMLLLFSRDQMLPMRVIGDRLQVHPTSVTNAVDRLEADGMVRRRPHPRDRRAVLVAVTGPGLTSAQSATQQLNTHVFADLGVGDEGERALTSILERMRHASGDF